MARLVLDLIRHGDALPAGPGGDAARVLSPTGRQTLERLGARLAAEGVRYERALASPLRRAVESADALLGAFSERPPVETLEALGPDSSPLQVLDALRRAGVAEHHALLIGHQPLLGQVAALLANAEASFAPGSLVRIEFTAGPAMGAGRIARTLHPRELDTA